MHQQHQSFLLSPTTMRYVLFLSLSLTLCVSASDVEGCGLTGTLLERMALSPTAINQSQLLWGGK